MSNEPVKHAAPRPGRPRVAAGKILGRLGHSSLPLAAGILAGFWLADREARFLPTTLGLVLVLILLGALLIPAGRILQGEAFEDTPDRRRLRKRVLAFGAVALAAGTLRLAVFWMESPSPLTELSAADFNAAYEIECALYVELNRGMDKAVAFLEAPGPVFDGPSRGALSAADERGLLAAWRVLYEHGFALDQIRMFYEDWFRFDPSRAQRSFHLRSYVLSYAAELALYEKSTRAVHRIRSNPNAVKFLNSPHPEAGLDADTFSFFRQELQGSKDRARVEAGERYLALLDRGFNGREEARGLGVGWLWTAAERHLATIRATAPMRKTAIGVESDLEALKRPTRRNWYPTQKKLAEWMGDTRVRRIGTYLVSREQQEGLDRSLQPGDILLSRKNWYLSNVGLPGFWPHAILYIGAPGKLSKHFETQEVYDYIEKISGTRQPLHEYLAAAHPAEWNRYSMGSGKDPFRVIEAVSEGVIFNTMDHAAGDYLAAMRPRLSKVEKARAVVEAFGHLGKPYDFDFDFATDHALVCTELVWRSYRPDGEMKGLEIPLVEVMGRNTLPATEIVSLYARARGRPQAQLEFVGFLDAKEKRGLAVTATEAAFAASATRTKWVIAQP